MQMPRIPVCISWLVLLKYAPKGFWRFVYLSPCCKRWCLHLRAPICSLGCCFRLVKYWSRVSLAPIVITTRSCLEKSVIVFFVVWACENTGLARCTNLPSLSVPGPSCQLMQTPMRFGWAAHNMHFGCIYPITHPYPCTHSFLLSQCTAGSRSNNKHSSNELTP